MPDIQNWIAQLSDTDPSQRRLAIIALGRSRERDALPALAVVRQKDDVPELRRLAAKAIRHIQAAYENPDPLRIDEAARHFEQAVETYREYGARQAIISLEKALKIDPTLADEKATRVITTSPDAILPPPVPWVPRSKPRVRSYILALMLLAALVFINSDTFRQHLNSLRIEHNVHTINGIDYYVVTPSDQSPGQGWPLLVLIPNHNEPAQELLLRFVEPARKAGVMLVAPQFAEYPQFEQVTPLLDSILSDVRRHYSVGEIALFGFSTGGEVATLYAQQSNQIVAVAAAAPTDIHLPPPENTTTRYLISYGEHDDLLSFNEASVQEFRSRPNPAEFLIIEDQGHELSAQQIEWAVGIFSRDDS